MAERSTVKDRKCGKCGKVIACTAKQIQAHAWYCKG